MAKPPANRSGRAFIAQHKRELLALAVIALGIGAIWLTGLQAGAAPKGCSLLLLEFSSTKSYDCWRSAFPSLTYTLVWDSFTFVPSYASVLYFASHQASAHALTDNAKAVGRVGMMSAVASAGFDIAENLNLYLVDLSRGDHVERSVMFALPKWIFVTVATFVAAQGVLRLLSTLRAKPQALDLINPPGLTAWERNTRVPGLCEERKEPNGVGIALSGGGIRSATFSMGAVQALQASAITGQANTLDGVSYISSVSGGGYFAGARQMLFESDPSTEPFLPGSLEENYVRVHGRYLAETVPEWGTAIARLIVGIVLNVGLLLGTLFVIGVVTGWFEGSVLFRDVSRPTGYMWGAVAVTIGSAAAAYLAAVISRPLADSTGTELGARLYRIAGALAVGGVIALSLAFVLPGITTLCTSLVSLIPGKSSETQIASGGGLFTSLLATWLGLRGGKGTPRKAFSGLFAGLRARFMKPTSGSALPKPSWVARFRVVRWLPGLLISLSALFVFAQFVAQGRRKHLNGSVEVFGLRKPLWLWWLGVVITILILYLSSDQTSWSLHPFYKRRLGSAFALARLSDGRVEPRLYDAPTALARHADKRLSPELIVCCAANLSGKIAPPGRRALSFTFTENWVGGPQLGYVSPESLRKTLGRKREGDASLLGAMAISGAAVASAMGRHSMGSLNAALALFNVRLGVWMPSPLYLERVARGLAPPPGMRRLGYVVREVIGNYDSADAHLYLSDGGHVENLGLVELLRRRCKLIFCFDCSGGPLTLLEGIRLAQEELGVGIVFRPDGYEAVREGSADAEKPNPVEARMAERRVLVGEISYPALADDLPAGSGVLVYGRAVLTPQTDDVILEYASRNALFPNDPTGDQWFDVEQFNHYLALGREVAADALDAFSASSPVSTE